MDPMSQGFSVGDTVKLTVAQAIVRYLTAQFMEIDGNRTRICGGGFGIFGHGNVPCLGEALYDVQDILPLYRGQNEQSMYLLRQLTPNIICASALCFALRRLVPARRTF